VARPQSQRTYLRACRRFATWLGPQAGPGDLTAANVARYHAHLIATGRASARVKKDRAALNSWLRWLVEHDRIPAAQARLGRRLRIGLTATVLRGLDRARYARRGATLGV
jgi:site-specific recombinase XerD